MHIPTYAAQELWRHLGNEHLKFYTSATSKNIPDLPGIYAWFCPLMIDDSLESSIKNIRQVYNYDASTNLHKGIKRRDFVQWQLYEWSIGLSADHKPQKGTERKWAKLLKQADKEDVKALKQIITLASVLSKPLYIGLTTYSLSARYEQHVAGSKGNNFNFRFQKYMQEIGQRLAVRDLVFAAMPIDIEWKDKNVIAEEDVVEIVEYVLKNVIGPVYGER